MMNTTLEHPAPLANRRLRACPQCDQGMQSLQLDGHYGTSIQIELCSPCRMVWFDPADSMQLSEAGVLGLIDSMAAAQRVDHTPGSRRPRCTQCRTQLTLTQNKTRFGANVQHDCPQGHGSLQTFAQYLAQKGYVRRIEYNDLPALKATYGAALEHLSCINCGSQMPPLRALMQSAHAAKAQELKDECTRCGTSLNMIDLPRLVRAIDRHGATLNDKSTAEHVHKLQQLGAAKNSIQCIHCGGQVQPTLQTHCSHCSCTIMISSLIQANALLQPMLPALQARHMRLDPLLNPFDQSDAVHVPSDEEAQVMGLNRDRHPMRKAAVKAAKHLMSTGEERQQQQLEKLQRMGLTAGVEHVLTALLGGAIICFFVLLWFGRGWAVAAGVALLAAYAFNYFRER